MNHMIHIAAVTQVRLDTEGRAYYRLKRAEGKKPMEAMRCLKRRLSDGIYRQLIADQQRPGAAKRGAGPGGRCGASDESSAVDLPLHIDTSDQSLPGPAHPTLPGHQAACEPLRGVGSSLIAPTRRSRQGGAPHWTNDLDGDKRRRTPGGAETALLTTERSRNDARCTGYLCGRVSIVRLPSRRGARGSAMDARRRQSLPANR